MLNKAIDIALRAHEGQVRKQSGLPYIVHPLEVMSILQEYGFRDEYMLSLGVLHDVIEDCEDSFAKEIIDLSIDLHNDVLCLTKRDSAKETENVLREASSLVRIVKVADIKSNTRTLLYPRYAIKKLDQMLYIKTGIHHMKIYKDTMEQLKSHV